MNSRDDQGHWLGPVVVPATTVAPLYSVSNAVM
jgi:hypothetical protein